MMNGSAIVLYNEVVVQIINQASGSRLLHYNQHMTYYFLLEVVTHN